MALYVTMENDGILRIRISGDMDKVQVDHLKNELSPFLDAATNENPLNSVIVPENIGKLSYYARRFFAEVNQDSRVGTLAIINPPRAVRILGKFIVKATKSDKFTFFSEEAEAVEWIKSTSLSINHQIDT
jgi:hypothetical protein